MHTQAHRGDRQVGFGAWRRDLFVVVGVLGILALAAVVWPSSPSSPNGSTSPIGLRAAGLAAPSGSAYGQANGAPGTGIVGSARGSGAASGAATGSSGGGSTQAGTVLPANGPFPGGLLIADRGNGRILIVDNAGVVKWRFPVAGSLPTGQLFSADDAFITPDLKRIVANDEFHEVIDVIDIATRKVVWQYGRYGQSGSGPGELHTPDDAYPLANGDITVADIRNCRVLEIAPDKHIVHTWGHLGRCTDHPPSDLNNPNGDTPLPDGGMLITDINGSRVIRLSGTGTVLFDIHVPVAYPSDAQLDPQGNVVVADFSTMGQVVAVDPKTGRVVWRWAPKSGNGRLNHPSLATPLANGLVSVNDDFRHRIVVIDPASGRVVWQYGHTDNPSTRVGYLNTPDGHQPLPAGFTLPA